MSFEPKPGMSIKLNGESIEFVSLEASGPASVFVYAEAGREGNVYKVLKNRKQYALKVFYPEYQDKRLIKNTERISQFKALRGFRVAERTVIDRKSFPDIVDEFPELNYSVLMPWIQGTIWGNLMISERPLPQGKYFQIAKILLEIIYTLEDQGLAHCDLSNNNFIIDPTLSSIELIDIEDMYAPDMPRPIPDISYGTIGYRTKWIAENGLWGPKSDRFASAILCSEIITWHNKEIRDNKAGDTSFFDEVEIGEASERYRIMKSYLGKLDSDLPVLFEKAWFSKNSDHCPPVTDWMNVVNKLDAPKTEVEGSGDYGDGHGRGHGGGTGIYRPGDDISHGVPPKMEVSHSLLDFGVLQKSNNELHIVIENTGGSVLTGSFILAPWMETSPSGFSIQPGDKRKIIVSINSEFPKPQSGQEYRAPNALVIESNAGVEVIGARYKLVKPPFYKTWLGWLLIGLLGIIIYSIFSGPESIAASFNSAPIVAINTATLRPTVTKILPTLKSTSTPRPTSTSRPTATKIPSTAIPASLGEVVKYKSIEISVLDVYRHDNLIPGNGYRYWAQDGYMIIDLVVKVQNTGPTPASIKWGDAYVIDYTDSSSDLIFAGSRSAAKKEKVDPLSIDYNVVDETASIKIIDTVYLRIVYIISEKPEQTVFFGIADSPQIAFTVKK